MFEMECRSLRLAAFIFSGRGHGVGYVHKCGHGGRRNCQMKSSLSPGCKRRHQIWLLDVQLMAACRVPGFLCLSMEDMLVFKVVFCVGYVMQNLALALPVLRRHCFVIDSGFVPHRWQFL